METNKYISPFSERYASDEMQFIFSQDKKFSTWRRLWIALAETEMELGLSKDGKPIITQEMIDEMKMHIEDINYDVARTKENKLYFEKHSLLYSELNGRKRDKKDIENLYNKTLIKIQTYLENKGNA